MHTRGVSEVADWIWEENLVRFLQHVSGYIGYSSDDHDEAALTGALESTDDDDPTDLWFTYPLEGRPPLTVAMAKAVHGGEVSIRVAGDFDPVLAARIETVMELL